MPSLSLLSLNHLHLPKCLRSLLNGDELEFCGQNDRVDDDNDFGNGAASFPPQRTHRENDEPIGDAFEKEATERRGDGVERGATTVKLVKTPGAILGLTVVGGVDKGSWKIPY